MLIKHFTKIVVVAALFVGFTACVSSEDDASRKAPGTLEAPAVTLGTSPSQLLTCTPGYQSCDIACTYSGGPSSDDCIVQCNAAGNGYTPVANCGWAQNSVYSASCRDLPPNRAVCEWN
jgi:hypothetical protein